VVACRAAPEVVATGTNIVGLLNELEAENLIER
jgi:hypothetical protein